MKWLLATILVIEVIWTTNCGWLDNSFRWTVRPPSLANGFQHCCMVKFCLFQVTREGYSCLGFAVKRGEKDLVDLALEIGCNLNTAGVRKALHSTLYRSSSPDIDFITHLFEVSHNGIIAFGWAMGCILQIHCLQIFIWKFLVNTILFLKFTYFTFLSGFWTCHYWPRQGYFFYTQISKQQ